MRWFRRLRTWQRVMLAVGGLIVLFAVANFALNLNWLWVSTTFAVYGMVAALLSFREQMRQAIQAEKQSKSEVSVSKEHTDPS